MSIIPQIYNQGTGLIGSTTEGNNLPDTVNDLIVQNTLTVLGDSTFNGQVEINNDLDVTGTVDSGSVITQALGSSTAETFSLPDVNGTNDQVLSITDETTNPITTEWVDATSDNFVSYNTTFNNLQNNLNQASPVDITELNLGTTDGTAQGELSVNREVNSNNSEQTFEVKESELSFKIDYSGVIDIFPRAELSISGVNAQASATMLIENDEFRQGIEIEQTEFTIRNVGLNVNPLKVQCISGGFWAFPENEPNTGDILRCITGGDGSEANPRKTEWS